MGALLLLALSLYLSSYYLGEQRRLAAAEDVQGAMNQVRVAERLDPFSPEPLQAEASLLQQQGRNKEAVESLNKAIQRDTYNYVPRMLLGELQMDKLNDYDAAAKTYREILEINPNLTMVNAVLAEALLRKGDLEGARREYEELRKNDQISLLGLYNLGRIYVRNGEPKKGKQTLEEARSLAVAGMESSESAGSSQNEELVQSINLSIADALVIQGQYDEAYQIVSESPSDQAAAILTLLENDPELYRQSIKNGEIY